MHSQMQMQRKFLNRILTVDCGLHTGWALWKGDAFPEVGEFSVPYKIKTHYEQRNYLADKFSTLMFLREKQIVRVYLEGTQSYTSVISRTAIAKGTLFELSYLVGRYEQICYDNGLVCEIINAPEWKGQMSKEITAAKIRMINDMDYKSEHIIDSVGMGFGIVGAFQWEIRKS